MNKMSYSHVRTCMKSGTGILPVGLGGIGILPMVHGLEAHATLRWVFVHVLRAWVVVLSLSSGLLLVGGCGPQKQVAGFRLPDAPRLVGGGLMIGWKAPQPGTVYLVEQQTSKLVETRSLDEGEVYSFAATSVIQADEFEQILGIKFSKARFALYFEPQDGAGEPAVARESLWAEGRF